MVIERGREDTQSSRTVRRRLELSMAHRSHRGHAPFVVLRALSHQGTILPSVATTCRSLWGMKSTQTFTLS